MLPQIKDKITSGSAHLSDNWAVIAALAQRHPGQTARGGGYSRWVLSDLDDHTVTLMLWGEAHAEHWKQMGGGLFCIMS